MKEIPIGTKGSASLTVSAKELAVNVGSGSLEVLATPVMIMLMEKAACSAVAPFLEGDETTVGTQMNADHLAATPEGMTVSAEAEVTAVNGREICFTVTAQDGSGEIGRGSHKRFLVFGQRFTDKAKAKLE